MGRPGPVRGQKRRFCGCLRTGRAHGCPGLLWIGTQTVTLRGPGQTPGLGGPQSDWRSQLPDRVRRPPGPLSWSGIRPSCGLVRPARARPGLGLWNGLRCHWTGWGWPPGVCPSRMRCACCRRGTVLFLLRLVLGIRAGQHCLETVQGGRAACLVQGPCGLPGLGRTRAHAGRLPGLALTRSAQIGLLLARGHGRGRVLMRVHGCCSPAFWNGLAESCLWQAPCGSPGPL